MQKLKFWKMSGAGNDFVLLTGGERKTGELEKLAAALCAPKLAVGADGLLYVNRAAEGSIEVRYFNSDGSEAFCGNGSRCAAWWAYSEGLVKERRFALKSAAGDLAAEIISEENVRMRMPDVPLVSLRHKGEWSKPVRSVHFLNTGVPHAVVPVAGLAGLDVAGLGRALRFHKAFGEAGANVNFVSVKNDEVSIRTYERGVEGETLACGTGITAAAVALGMDLGLASPVTVLPRCGDRFKVWFERAGAGAKEIYVQGPAKIVFTGEINV